MVVGAFFFLLIFLSEPFLLNPWSEMAREFYSLGRNKGFFSFPTILLFLLLIFERENKRTSRDGIFGSLVVVGGDVLM